MNETHKGVFRLSTLTFSENKKNLSHRKAHDKHTNPNQPLSYHGRKAPLCASSKASFTIEAALALPLFLYLILAILLLFQVMKLQMMLRDAAYDAARALAATSYITEEQSEEASTLISGLETAGSYVTAQSKVTEEDLLSLVVGGRAGILCSSEDADADMVRVSASCLIRMPIPLPVHKYLQLSETVCVRKWIGYTGAGDGGGQMVYVTETGSVYHKDRDCSYLNPSVQAVTLSERLAARNESGGIYHACKLCGSNSSLVYYITDYGDSYHTSATCSGLKRTIYTVTEEEANKHACSKCGGDH